MTTPASPPTTKGSGPLDGIVVLEVGAFMAAPFATMHLADLGARVLKVENPATGGDPVRATGPFVAGESSPFARLNRNKESVGLDLKHPDGLAAFRRLVEGADVLVENLRPGTMQRLGLGYDELRQLNPRLIYASASGWGQDGPLAMLPGLDIMAQARGGLMSITGTADGDPVKIGVPICDLVCAMYVSMAVLAALRQRDIDGEGQHLDVSLLEAGVSFAIWEAGKYFATGEVGAPLGSAHQSTAPYQAVRTSDGHVTVGAVTPKTWEAFCRALDLGALLEDERYASASDRHAHRPTLIPSIEAVTATLTTDEVIERLDAAGVPCAPIANYEQVFNDDHLNQRGYFWDAEHPVMGSVRQLGSPMRMSRTPARRGNAGPLLGQDTRAALEEVGGFSASEVTALAEAGVVVDPMRPGPPPHRPAGSPQPPTD
ncbi:CaiB/BaiF CoA-transferase family protein [Nocardioides sp. zg-1228]|uniref:CaiB/BaiF CoA transferase family protein n=1 Tax=Nocardioides sp. zg-1228 TaxID=2763008 RepID=UPI001642E32C|nr:CoA transferase [Nocardioides sp. zg-1228]MBC2935145.1 CoA transferase [Nocardioides sp. zg-1228]QSF56984.1 CoA transferase [Nocardioides sp. zg-1228]